MDVTDQGSRVDLHFHRLIRFLPLGWRDEWASVLFFQLLVVSLLLRLLWLPQPQGALVFDESYYVNAARVIAGIHPAQGAPYADAKLGLDPNKEHLPLAKLMIAGSIRVFGDNAFGWRIPSVFFGTLAVALLYFLVKRLTKRPWLALFAAFIFSFDNLVFVHGRIATLDIFMVAFMLLGIYLYVAGRPELSGVAFALSALSKFNGAFALIAIIGFEALRITLQPDRGRRLWRSFADLLVLGGTFTTILLAILWPLDRQWTTFANPVDHVRHVYDYGVSLRRDSGPQGIESLPWQWLINEVEIPYFKQNVNVSVDGKVVSSRATVSFAGEMNPFIIAMLPLALAYLVDAALRKRQDLPLLMLALMAATYLPSLASALLFHRISYIFYFLPVLPALCAAIAYMLVDLKLPRILPLAYAASVIMGFIALFPFRTMM